MINCLNIIKYYNFLFLRFKNFVLIKYELKKEINNTKDKQNRKKLKEIIPGRLIDKKKSKRGKIEKEIKIWHTTIISYTVIDKRGKYPSAKWKLQGKKGKKGLDCLLFRIEYKEGCKTHWCKRISSRY